MIFKRRFQKLSKRISYAFLFVVIYIFSFNSVQAFSITGTLYENDGTTAITTQPTIAAAIGTSTPSVLTTTAAVDGTFTISGITPTSSISNFVEYNTSPFPGMNSVVWGNGKFVAVGRGDAGRDANMYSYDGINWTVGSGAANFWFKDVAYGDGTWGRCRYRVWD